MRGVSVDHGGGGGGGYVITLLELFLRLFVFFGGALLGIRVERCFFVVLRVTPAPRVLQPRRNGKAVF